MTTVIIRDDTPQAAAFIENLALSPFVMDVKRDKKTLKQTIKELGGVMSVEEFCDELRDATLSCIKDA